MGTAAWIVRPDAAWYLWLPLFKPYMNTMAKRSSNNLNRSITAVKNWPIDIEYINSQIYDSLPQHVLSCIVNIHKRSELERASQTIANHDIIKRRCSNALAVIRLIDDPLHPAYGQRGLFAASKIPPRTHIVDYLGEVHYDDRPLSDYDISLYRSQDGTINIGVDALRKGNEARFINDFRGIRCKPNAVFLDNRSESGELRISIWSDGQCIRKGEEILVSYGKSWWRARETNS